MSNPIRKEFECNTELTDYVQWTPVVDGSVVVSNVSETYYLNDSGIVTLDICALVIMGSDTSVIEITSLPVVPESSTDVTHSVKLCTVEDNKNIDATFGLNASVDADKIILTSASTLMTGVSYVVSGIVTYVPA